jgi:glutaminyl-peptide cyclotransferase
MMGGARLPRRSDVPPLALGAVLLVLLACAGPPVISGQAAPPLKFDSSRAWDHLRKQVGFGPRPVGSPSLAETRRYILEQLKALGITAHEQAFEADTPALGRVRIANVIGTIAGASSDRIALATHYDTKFYREFRFLGANDGGSSTAVLLELARILKARKNPFTVELLFFDGEEATRPDWAGTDHTYGSRHYVMTAKQDGTLRSLRALILLDLVGDRQLNFRRELGSTRWLTDSIWATAARLGYQSYFLPEDTGPIADDHAAFVAAGVPAVDLIDLDYGAWHTPGDTLDAVSARSLQVTGEVVLEALPRIEKRLAARR